MKFYTETARKRLRYLFLTTTSLLSSCGVDYWLDRGTLLGAYRKGTLIPGDDDIDLRFMHDNWLKLYEHLRSNLPNDLRVSALHHGHIIYHTDGTSGESEAESSLWFRNEDGVFPVALQETKDGSPGVRYHTATALCVHFTDSEWDEKPNLDLYTYRLNDHHDCMPPDSPRPWEEDGTDYLCSPSRRVRPMLVPAGCVFPLGSISFEGSRYPAPGSIREYLEHLFGYLGEDSEFDSEARVWRKVD